MRSKIIVSGLNYYPIKSCRGVSITTADIGVMGIRYDRQWMVVNENGIFVAQRGDKQLGAVGVRSMCLIEPAITTHQLVVIAPGMLPISLPLAGNSGPERSVRIWDSISTGIDQGDEAARWFTEYLSREVPGNYRLVRMPDEGTRTTERGNDKVAFADAYPFLLTSEATLDGLNGRMQEALPMNRFRPNIVVTGCDALAEDTFSEFRIRDIGFTGIKRCGRCPITTIDQHTGIAGKEPLTTLATFNRQGSNVYFGMYLTHSGSGMITLGDRLFFE
jgi:hypothetical protein